MQYKNKEVLQTHLSKFDNQVVLVEVQKEDQTYWVHVRGDEPVAFEHLQDAKAYAEEKSQSFYQ